MSVTTHHPREVVEALTAGHLTALDAALRRWQQRRRLTWLLGDPGPETGGATAAELLQRTVDHLTEIGA